ncbi:MAG: HU family DNA-binding protein [Acidobacteria bacterium]|nr:HU family DNA-binding protein [Acidobacteriota bacterium]MCB9378227.1 HU family DNA-binding protein [Holophagales bacterium]
MNKVEMAEKLATKCELTKTKALEIVNCIFDTAPGHGIIAVELDAGRSVDIQGFGSFSTKHRAARKGRNPATGETIDIAAKHYPDFRAGKGLKDRVAK